MSQNIHTALITGASSGLGEQFAYILAKKGIHLIIVARRKERLLHLKQTLEEKYHISVQVIATDLSCSNNIDTLLDTIKILGIRIHYLINNAGFGLAGAFTELSYEEQQTMMRLNMEALVKLCYLFAPEIAKEGGGYILNVASTAALVPGPFMAIYFASKAFVHSFSLALSKELASQNIKVTALLPGATDTEFAQVSGAKDKTLLFKKSVSARAVADAGVKAMLQGKFSIITGINRFTALQMKLSPLMPPKLVLSLVQKALRKRILPSSK